MKTIVKNLVFGIIVLSLSMSSCSKESDGAIGPQGSEGEQGIQGIEGEQGTAGTPGVDGTNGTNGINGSNGTNGMNGADGNANVSVYKFAVPANYSENFYSKLMPEFAGTALSREVILSFVKDANNAIWPLPGRVEQGVYDIYPGYDYTKFYMSFYESGTSNRKKIPAGRLKEFRIVIIKSSTVTGKSTKDSVLAELKANGVDVKDYNAICDYYGLAY